jgi:site-specific recombinase XerD
MQNPVTSYLDTLRETRRSELTIKAARQTLQSFQTWWEADRNRSFDLALLRDADLERWRLARQRDHGAAPATINRQLSLLRSFCAWATQVGCLAENPAASVAAIASTPLAPKSIASEAVDALLREARTESDPLLRLRNEAVLALLVYAGLRVQEACDVQLRDLDLAGGAVTIRHGKAGKARRVPLHPEAQKMLHRYLNQVRCPSQDLPAVGSDLEREPLLVRRAMAQAGQPIQMGITQRLVQRLVEELGRRAAARLHAEAAKESNLEHQERLGTWAQALETVTPHILRHSLARRLLSSGAQLSEVQRVLGHSRLSTTGIYLTPSEEDVRTAIGRAGV